MTKVTRLTLEEGSVLERRRLHLREVTPDADAPLDTVGADLRAARGRKGVDIATVSDQLKIKPEHLTALEDGDISALPGRAYAIGFLRSYAEYLGLDPAACIERFKTEIAGRGEPEEQVVSFQAAEDMQRKLPQGWIVFVVLLLIAVVWGGYYLSQSANRMLTQSITPVPSTPSSQQLATQPRPAPAAPPAASQAVAVIPSPTATVASVQRPTPSATSAPTDLPTGTQYGLVNKNYRLMLRIHKVTRVLVQGPTGTVYINRALQPGDTYQAPNVSGLLITTGDADAVEVILDSESVGRLGKGVANGVSLNPQDIMDRAHRPG